ncbi:uncharacterized protein EURHEDRAFT_124855 [Aspergillus ruber CBS 135680]|uniref:Uncharacterized protein n=1 Tax=Aspergillus ruber (strain CBS 135680) TaxID=1388766 RepID=A0A017SQ12_ASPRC|nr:uncharacterized protein EURHEDRAFT_124855 [Aspergillus ruber CBS 135680]EYE99033.1 hypothetical protein EURHEDRAFT_124855 [Aspergillus ruber CBS 135680]
MVPGSIPGATNFFCLYFFSPLAVLGLVVLVNIGHLCSFFIYFKFLFCLYVISIIDSAVAA